MTNSTPFSHLKSPHYLLMTRNNYCAAFILQFLETKPESTPNLFTSTLQQLQAMLPQHFSLKAINQALHLLHEDGYVSLTSDSMMRGQKKNIRPFTLRIDHLKITSLGDACAILASPDRHSQITKELQQRHKTEQSRVGRHVYRATREHLPTSLTLFQWMQTLAYFNYRCAYCEGPYHLLEHYVPLAHGGSTAWSNCVPACRNCNVKKGTHHPEVMTHMTSLAHIEAYLSAIQHIEETLQLRAREQAVQARKEALEQMSATERGTIAGLRSTEMVRCFFLSDTTTRPVGYFCVILFCGVVIAPWFLPHDWHTFQQWAFLFVAALVGIVLAFHPKIRQQIASWSAQDKVQEKARIEYFMQLILERKKNIQAAQEEGDRRIAAIDHEQAKQRILARIEKQALSSLEGSAMEDDEDILKMSE